MQDFVHQPFGSVFTTSTSPHRVLVLRLPSWTVPLGVLVSGDVEPGSGWLHFMTMVLGVWRIIGPSKSGYNYLNWGYKWLYVYLPE